ncbi:FAD dependent oxidoreductase, partial [mine drainage metagenome]
MEAVPSGNASSFDAIVIGGGPNGLMASSYLARAGAHVLLLERRIETGGGLNTDEYFGFRFNLHAIYHMMADVMPAFRDLDLWNFGLRY